MLLHAQRTTGTRSRQSRTCEGSWISCPARSASASRAMEDRSRRHLLRPNRRTRSRAVRLLHREMRSLRFPRISGWRRSSPSQSSPISTISSPSPTSPLLSSVGISVLSPPSLFCSGFLFLKRKFSTAEMGSFLMQLCGDVVAGIGKKGARVIILRWRWVYLTSSDPLS